MTISAAFAALLRLQEKGPQAVVRPFLSPPQDMAVPRKELPPTGTSGDLRLSQSGLDPEPDSRVPEVMNSKRLQARMLHRRLPHPACEVAWGVRPALRSG